MILAGDIGGTNARLCLLTATGGRVVRREVYPSRTYPNLEAVVREFLGPRPPTLTAACFGVAGPVVDNRCSATNLPWVIDGRVLARRLKIPHVLLLNDLVALALGTLTLPAAKLRVLQGEKPFKRKKGTVAVLAAGTGLGEAVLVWDPVHRQYVPCPTEGGHADFGPRDELEVELFQFLRDRFGHVSYERVVSGPGIGNVYDFFRVRKGVSEPLAVTEAILAAPDRNALIAKLGMSGESEACARALEVFVSLFGAEAGNLALKVLATGGVFIAGSIAGRLLKSAQQTAFMTSFTSKGRFAPLMEKIPVALVLDPDVGLAGSIYQARRL